MNTPLEPTRLGNSTVMGGSAMLVLATAAGVAGFAQLSFGWGSMVVIKWGGNGLANTWSLLLVVAAILMWAGALTRHIDDTVALELGAVALIDFCVVIYFCAIASAGHPDQAVFVLAFLSSTILNISGRAVLLIRRVLALRRLRR